MKKMMGPGNKKRPCEKAVEGKYQQVLILR